MSQAAPPRSLAAGIYVRISSDPELTRLGVQRQEQDCREYVERHDLTLAQVYEDNDLSAYSGKARPAYRRLLEDVRAGTIQAVVAWQPDRLYRNPRDLQEFIEVVEAVACRVETVKAGNIDFTTANGRMIARILGATAIGESELKAERQRRKHQELAAAGKDAGGGRPFGYEADRKTLRPAEAELIREAVKRALDGASLRSICVDWDRRSIATVTGTRWSSQVMRRMLASGRISGRRDYRAQANGSRRDIGQITSDSAVWPAIISAPDSDKLREMLSDPDRRKNAAPRRYLLTGGLAVCGLCGKPLTARPRGDKRRSMVCATGPGFHGCGKIRVLAEPVEELATEAVLQAIDRGALAAAMAQQDDREAVDGLLGVDAKLADLARDWAEDRISRGEWEAARGALESRRAGLQRRVEAQRRAHDLDGLPDPLRPAWPSLSLHRQRAILSAVVEAVVIGPAVRGLNRFDPDRVTIRWKV